VIPEIPPLEPLGVVKCGETDCVNNLHWFRQKKRRNAQNDRYGACVECGATLIDWERVHRQDLTDVSFKIEMLKLERIRHFYWCELHLPKRIIESARRIGRAGMYAAVRKRLKESIGKAKIFRDGIQTPQADSDKANIIHCGQHATATCCRRCVEEWYSIKLGRPLTDSELDYLTELVCRYIDTRVPGLDPEPVGE